MSKSASTGRSGKTKTTLKRDTVSPGLLWHPGHAQSNKEWKAQDDSITAGTRYEYASQIPQATRAGQALPYVEGATRMSEAQRLNSRTSESGKQASRARGHACCPSVDNIMIAMSYGSDALTLYS